MAMCLRIKHVISYAVQVCCTGFGFSSAAASPSPVDPQDQQNFLLANHEPRIWLFEVVLYLYLYLSWLKNSMYLLVSSIVRIRRDIPPLRLQVVPIPSSERSWRVALTQDG